ncbi:MFS transporter [Halogeometricum sp. wsp3]|nr:MFS transporter [Halogeometricum sp. wsp3]
MLLVGAFTMGLASGVYLTAANTLVSELFPERPGRALGQHGVAAQLAAVGAPALISFVLVVGTWRTALQGIAVAAGVVTVAFTIIARRAQLPTPGAKTASSSARRVSSGTSLSPASLAIGVAGLVWNGLFGFGCTSRRASDCTGSGRTLMLLAFGAGVPAFYVSGRLADRLPSIPYLLTILAAFTGCVLVLPSLTGFWSLAAFSVIVGYVIHSSSRRSTRTCSTRFRTSPRERLRHYAAGMMVMQAPGSALVGRLLDAGVTFPTLLRGMGVAFSSSSSRWCRYTLMAGCRVPPEPKG